MVAPSLWYHGAVGQWQGWQPSGPTRCDHWNCHLGIHFASKLITAQRFASEANLMPHDYFQYADTWHPSQGQVVTATLNLENPLVLAEEIALDALALAIALDTRLVDYEVLAQPFEWKFTRSDLAELLKRLAAKEQAGLPEAA